MELFLIILTVFGLSADAFAISLTSGLFIKHIKINKALKIALFFACFQTFMPLIGWKVGMTVIELIYKIGYWISFGLLSILGIRMIDDSLKAENDEVEKAINPLENYTLLGLALNSSIDELALGFTSRLSEVSIFTLASSLGLITFILSFFGVLVSHKIGKIINKKVKLVGGLLLLIISIEIFWNHLFAQIVQ
ncbi:MAG: manganese efflux pump [Xenococcaceae cyanobacterium MO_188.B32]|nr:manganese efflux pump [Xenococcaceae cyanobacterium MO_188.B32]